MNVPYASQALALLTSWELKCYFISVSAERKTTNNRIQFAMKQTLPIWRTQLHALTQEFRSLNATVAQPKNWPYEVKYYDWAQKCNYIRQQWHTAGYVPTKCVSVLSGVVVIYLRSIKIYKRIKIYDNNSTVHLGRDKANTEIRTELNTTAVLDKIQEYKTNWLQRVNWMPGISLVRILRNWRPTDGRNRGRPVKKLLDAWDRNWSSGGPTPC